MPVLQEQKPVIDAHRWAAVWSCSFGVLSFLPLPRLAGVSNARHLLWGAPKVGALGEHPVKSCQVNPWPGHQGYHPGDKIQRVNIAKGVLLCATIRRE
jgi:hypothetical protein